MIPVKLTLDGFLSYREEARIDFSQLDVACISGANGAGKSSLFDAITWVLFGRARRNDDALINNSADACRVALEFDYEENRYRVERIKERGKSGLLEFQILAGQGKWKPLTEAGMRATEDRIRQTLRLDYETFINSSFFLQGKADMFAQQSPAKRKEILGSVLGLEIWETYREETFRRRRIEEDNLKIQQQLLDEILAELGQEGDRKDTLKLLNQNLEKTAALRQEKEKNWNQAQSQFQKIKSEKEKLDLLIAQFESDRKRFEATGKQIVERQTDLQAYEQVLEKAAQINKAYQEWQALRQKLEKWNALAEQFHNLRNDRSQFDTRLRTEEAGLLQEQKQLLAAKQEMQRLQAEWPSVQAGLEKAKSKLAELEDSIKDLAHIEDKLAELQSSSSELIAENRQLKMQMNELDGNIKTLEKAGGPQCPLCGQSLTDEHRSEIVGQYNTRGKALGDQHRLNMRLLKDNQKEQNLLKKSQTDLRRAQSELTALQRVVGQNDQRAEDFKRKLEKWQREQEPRLTELESVLAERTFSQPVRVQLQQVDASIEKLGYAPDEHERCRRKESEIRVVEETYRELEKAKTAVESLRREIGTLKESLAGLQEKIKENDAIKAGLELELEKQHDDLSDIDSLEEELKDLRSEENNLRQQVGAAQQMVNVLEKQRQRQAEIGDQMLEIKDRIANLHVLELAFGKDGIPALLIEQALPEIETQANDALDRLSGGRMSITFMTEREYKDKKREDKKQTLDILISDASGQREYELFSGGEAFRINFAIRLALSRVLAQRAGARLQTLVIDEGFGSQDAEGRQRLIEAINLVSRDFVKILVITHLDELKDAFPSRIEVQKTQNGSMVEVIP